jgi:hypothetical protein
MPLGAFTKDGTYFEGDIVKSQKKPNCCSQVLFNKTIKAKKGSRDELGNDLFESRTMKSVMLDAMLKIQWTAMLSYMSRNTTKNAVTINPSDNAN